MGRGKNKHKCVHHWVINSVNVGHCIRPGCDAVKDFGKLQDRAARLPEWMREKASAGGKRGTNSAKL